MNKLILAFALIAPLFSAPAFAAERAADVHVAYQDLRLASAEGRATLDRRISSAIETACDIDARSFTLADKRAAKRCIAAKRVEVAPLRAAALAQHGVPVQVARNAY